MTTFDCAPTWVRRPRKAASRRTSPARQREPTDVMSRGQRPGWVAGVGTVCLLLAIFWPTSASAQRPGTDRPPPPVAPSIVKPYAISTLTTDRIRTPSLWQAAGVSERRASVHLRGGPHRREASNVGYRPGIRSQPGAMRPVCRHPGSGRDGLMIPAQLSPGTSLALKAGRTVARTQVRPSGPRIRT